MIGSIYYFVLNMSITAALIIVLLLIITAVFGRWNSKILRISKSLIYPLWGIVLFRMLIPVSLPSKLSLMNLINGYITKTVSIPQIFKTVPSVSSLNTVKAAAQYFPLVYKSHIIEDFFRVSGVVWICGTVLLIVTSIIIYCLTAVELKKAVLVKNDEIIKVCMDRLNTNRKVRLFESGFVSSPVVFGIFKPRIIIPKDMPEEDLEYALLHEISHINHFDNLWKVISVFAVCIHWFNPFAWLFLHVSSRDMEFACDERVLKAIPDTKKKYYANALYLLAAKQLPVFTAFGGTGVKARVLNIAGYKRIPLFMAAAAGIVCIALAVLLITNPAL